MSPVWVIPALVLLVGGVAAAALLRSLLHEAGALVAELRRTSELRPAVVRLQAETSRLAVDVRSLLRR